MENTTALALPDEAQFRQDIQAINRFQQVVHANMVKGHDYGVIPGTQKPTLLKPGAEKIAKLLGLSDQYEILDRQEDWQSGFFRYLIKCRLIHIAHGVTISEGVGECNSMESKYRFRWVFQSELPSHLQGDEGKAERDKLSNKMVNTRNGKVKMYRVDNEDIYSQVNTILKMAKKRALVDASLSAGRLSDVFTQDIEDLPDLVREEPVTETKPNAKPKVKSEPETVAESQPEVEPQPQPEPPTNQQPDMPTGQKVQNIAELKGLLVKHKIGTKEALAAMGISSFSELADLDDAWDKVKQAQGI